MRFIQTSKAGAPEEAAARRGQAMTEFSLVAPLFLLLVFGIMDFGRLFFWQMTLQNALREAGRFATTGRHLPDPANPPNTLSRIDSIIQVAQQAAQGIDVQHIEISSPQGGLTRPAGGPGETVVIALTTSVKLMTPLIGAFFGPQGQWTFTVSTTFRNEPFDPSLST